MCRVLTSCVGFLFDLIALMACLGAFSLPHWVHCPDGCSRSVTQHIGSLANQIPIGTHLGLERIGLESFSFEGLLVRVSHDHKWKYFWDDDFRMEQELPGGCRKCVGWLEDGCGVGGCVWLKGGCGVAMGCL